MFHHCYINTFYCECGVTVQLFDVGFTLGNFATRLIGIQDVDFQTV